MTARNVVIPDGRLTIARKAMTRLETFFLGLGLVVLGLGFAALA